jgi:phosphoglycerate dehydrogenase-like enzyme
MGLPRACITLPLSDAARARLAPACETSWPAPGCPREELVPHLDEAEGLLCSAVYPIDEALLDAAPRLRVISNFGVGFNNVDVADATRRGIVVCNTPGVLNDAVADLTLALILAAARHVPANAAYAASGGWTARAPAPGLGFDLAGKTLGIVGYGRIGQAVGRRARAFGMRVIYHDVVAAASDEAAEERELAALMAEADVVSVHTNLTPESRHLVGAAQIAQMKPTAWLVNTARGPIVDEAALVAALHAGTIAGAALDVIEVEPPPAGAPILSAPNTIILPHVGSATVEARAAMLDLCLSNLIAVLGRQAPPACVNPEALQHALSR